MAVPLGGQTQRLLMNSVGPTELFNELENADDLALELLEETPFCHELPQAIESTALSNRCGNCLGALRPCRICVASCTTPVPQRRQ